MTFEQMWRDLAPVGRSAASGGYFRQPWTSAETELRSWFAEQATARGLRLVADALGNQVAWWDVPGATEPGVLTGSHLDSVLDGGAYDGPLGVVSAFAAVDRLREQGHVPTRPLGVAAFVEEEGSRFGRACLGSRLAVGAASWADARELRDRAGVVLPDALVAAGLDPTPLETGDDVDVLAGVAAYVVVMVVVGQVLPSVDEVGDFPGSTLWYFRRASLITTTTMWAVIGVLLTGAVGRLAQQHSARDARRQLAASL